MSWARPCYTRNYSGNAFAAVTFKLDIGNQRSLFNVLFIGLFRARSHVSYSPTPVAQFFSVRAIVMGWSVLIAGVFGYMY